MKPKQRRNPSTMAEYRLVRVYLGEHGAQMLRELGRNDRRAFVRETADSWGFAQFCFSVELRALGSEIQRAVLKPRGQNLTRD
ncbi:MAG: hypothetical protein ACOC2N_01670 [Spirochaetota bacterium]